MHELKIMIVAMSFFTATYALANDWSAGPGGYGEISPLSSEEGDMKKGHRGFGKHRGGPGGHKVRPGKAEVEACATSLNIALPAKGSEAKLTEEQRESLKACMKTAGEAKRAAMESCLKAAGVTFGENGRPSSRPTREQMESCRNVSLDSSTATNSGSAL